VSSPRFPSTSVTSTPGSCLNAAAKLAACWRIPPQTGHCRITTFFMVCTPCTKELSAGERPAPGNKVQIACRFAASFTAQPFTNY
jgi:hypothetical protein